MAAQAEARHIFFLSFSLLYQSMTLARTKDSGVTLVSAVLSGIDAPPVIDDPTPLELRSMNFRTGIVVATSCIVFGVGHALEAGSIRVGHESVAAEKKAAADVIYYERVLTLDEDDHRIFEHIHPFYAKLFSDPHLMTRTIDEWEAHERGFDYKYPCLGRVIEGYVTSDPGLPGGGGEPGGINPDGGGGGGGDGSGGDSGGGGGGGGGITSVPEPSTGSLAVVSLVIVTAWLALRRYVCIRQPCSKEPTAARQPGTRNGDREILARPGAHVPGDFADNSAPA
jgi:uncharacterized membrane protein YgcG